MTKKLLYIGLIILLYTCFITLFSRYRYVDSYVSDNFARDIKNVQNSVNELCLELSYDGKYKDYSTDDMLDMVRDTDRVVSEISYRIPDYRSLNENFDIRLYAFDGILTGVEETLESGRKLSSDQLALLNQLVTLNKTYSELGNSKTYSDDYNTLSQMDMPQEVNDYLDKVGEIKRKYIELE